MFLQLGLSTAAFYGRWETEEAAASIAKMPVSCAEVFLQTGCEYELPFAQLVRRNLGAVRCTSVHPTGIQFENQMFGRSRRQRGEAFDAFRRVLDAAQELGAACYVYHGKSTAQLKPLPWNLQANLDMIGEMSLEAEKRNLIIAWENVFWCQLTTCERVLQVRRAMPQARFTLDIKQAMRAGQSPIDMARAMGSGLVNVHVCDWDEQGKLCLPGEGVVDFKALFAALSEIDYRGPVILEPYLALITGDESLMRSLAFLAERMVGNI